MEIKKALENSDVVIMVLSDKSVNKRGYFQREIRIALDLLNEIPEGEVFIIALLLDEIEIPASIEKYQAFKAYNEDLERLFESIGCDIDLKRN